MKKIIGNTLTIADACRHGRRCINALGGVFAKQKLLVAIAAGMLLLSTCFSPWAGNGNLTITWGGGRTVNDPSQLKNLDYTVTLKGPSGTIQENFSQGITRASFNVIPGIWTLTIKGYYAGTTRLEVMGIEQIDVKPKNTFSPINIYNVEEAENWYNINIYMNVPNTLNSGRSRMVIIKNDIEFTDSNNQISVIPTLPIILIAEKDVTISRVGDPPNDGISNQFPSFFNVPGGGNLTLGKPGMGGTITIDNKNKYSKSLVQVNGNLVMNKGVTIQNGYFEDINTSGVETGGVHVSSTGKFTMYGGTIRNNYVPQLNTGMPADVHGGGVYVESGGTFIRQGGTISGNTPHDIYPPPPK